MPIPARSIPTRVGAESLSTGTSTERDTHGREAALLAPTPIREDRTQRGKCCDSSSSIRSHSSQVRICLGSRNVKAAYPLRLLDRVDRIEILFAAVHGSRVGTKRTNRAGQTTSVVRSRPEVAGRWSKGVNHQYGRQRPAKDTSAVSGTSSNRPNESHTSPRADSRSPRSSH